MTAISVRDFPQRQLFICRRLALLAMLLALGCGLAAAQAGTLDPTFATGGIFTTSFTEYSSIDNVMALQSDGKIILAGTGSLNGTFGGLLIRLNTNGTLDTTFGSGGFVLLSSTEGGEVFGIALLSNGQILVGTDGLPNTIIRLDSNGTLDTTFGANGIASTKSIQILSGESSAQSYLALLPSGEILMTGSGVMARFTSSGQLDLTFGNAGIAALATPVPSAVAALSSGKILVAAGQPLPATLPLAPPLPVIQGGTITRYNANGSLDTTFGAAGQAACICSATAIAVQSDGKIAVAGTVTTAIATIVNSFGVTNPNNQTGFGLVRYNANGTIDTTFNHGSAAVGFGSSFPAGEGLALAIQSNGDIVAGGQAGVGDTNLFGYTSSSYALARFTSTGQLDSTFGQAGTVLTQIGTSNSISFVSALAIQSDGKILAAGNTGPFAGEYTGFLDNFAVARYLGQ
jgi:uncharacterized delta-60 repeat protein